MSAASLIHQITADLTLIISIFKDPSRKPTLVHSDLCEGNVATDMNTSAVII